VQTRTQLVRADSNLRPHGIGGRGGEGRGGEGRKEYIRANAFLSARMHRRVHADASILALGNFIVDATVCLSHG
jgi:hypothetical protein